MRFEPLQLPATCRRSSFYPHSNGGCEKVAALEITTAKLGLQPTVGRGELVEDKDELRGKVIIDLEPVSCSLRMNNTRDEGAADRMSLSMKARLPKGVKVRTTDERSLTNAEWGLTLYGAGVGSQLSERHNAVGQLNYLSEFTSKFDDDDFPESCSAWAILDGDTFNLIRDLA